MKETVVPEWSHKVVAENVGLVPFRVTISASEQERKDLARRLRIKSVGALDASFVLERNQGSLAVHVTGDLRAQVTQLCVITLEPVPQEISTSLEGWYADPARIVSIEKARHEKLRKQRETELPILEEEIDPEPLIDGQIDLGELATQHLALALDPYPHKEGVVFEAGASEDGEKQPVPDVRRNPFAALKNWKNGGRDGSK